MFCLDQSGGFVCSGQLPELTGNLLHPLFCRGESLPCQVGPVGFREQAILQVGQYGINGSQIGFFLEQDLVDFGERGFIRDTRGDAFIRLLSFVEFLTYRSGHSWRGFSRFPEFFGGYVVRAGLFQICLGASIQFNQFLPGRFIQIG